MKTNDISDLIKIDEYSSTPKYLQLSNLIIAAIEDGKLKTDDTLPSINDLSYILDISRDTAEKGYKYLKAKGVIKSVPGKGYYIRHTDFKQELKIFLLFNKLSAHKKMIYDAFVEALGENVSIDFYIYNNDFALFKKLIQNRKSNYSNYVIIPHFNEGGEMAYEVIDTLPKTKLIVLDKKVLGLSGEFSQIYENFEKDIYDALMAAKEALGKYHTIKILFPKDSYYPKEILNGFKRFCLEYAFNHTVIHDIEAEDINPGEVFINLMEDDLVILINRIISQKLKLGKDVGIISYNETPLKKLILDGITTISTDFKLMGSMAAETILRNEIIKKEVPFYLTLRNSL